MIAAIAVLLSLAGCSAAQPAPAASAIAVVRQDGGFLVREAGRPVFFYQLAPKSLAGRYERSNYIHPLYGLDGEILTEDFPQDHYHHRGVFWAWHQVLVGDVRAGDPWLARHFSWQLQDAAALPAGNGVRAVHRWFSPDFAQGAEPILEETARISVHPAAAGVRLVDFDIRLEALQAGVRLGGSDDAKGYGGFSLRVRLQGDLRFTAASGALAPAPLALEAGAWVDFSGGFGPRPGPASGVAVFVHPTSPGYPRKWILRGPDTPSMQNPAWPGAAAVPMPRGRPVRLRYRLAVHRGGASRVALVKLAKDYAASR